MTPARTLFDQEEADEMPWKAFKWLDDQPTEEEVRLELVRQLSRKYRISAERAIPTTRRVTFPIPPPSPVYRYDLGLHLSDGTLIGLVEVKRDWTKKHRSAGQYQAYRDSGVPWRYCRGPAELADTIAWAVKLHARYGRKLSRARGKPRVKRK